MKAVLTVLAALCLAGCIRPKTFTVRVLVERPGVLEAGDPVRVVHRNGDHAYGVFTGITVDRLHTETGSVGLAEISAIDVERIAIGKLLVRGWAVVAAGVALLVLVLVPAGA